MFGDNIKKIIKKIQQEITDNEMQIETYEDALQTVNANKRKSGNYVLKATIYSYIYFFTVIGLDHFGIISPFIAPTFLNLVIPFIPLVLPILESILNILKNEKNLKDVIRDFAKSIGNEKELAEKDLAYSLEVQKLKAKNDVLRNIVDMLPKLSVSSSVISDDKDYKKNFEELQKELEDKHDELDNLLIRKEINKNHKKCKKWLWQGIANISISIISWTFLISFYLFHVPSFFGVNIQPVEFKLYVVVALSSALYMSKIWKKESSFNKFLEALSNSLGDGYTLSQDTDELSGRIQKLIEEICQLEVRKYAIEACTIEVPTTNQTDWEPEFQPEKKYSSGEEQTGPLQEAYDGIQALDEEFNKPFTMLPKGRNNQ